MGAQKNPFLPIFLQKSMWYTCGTGGALMKRREGAFLAKKREKTDIFRQKIVKKIKK